MLRIFAILFLAFTPSLGQAILFKSADVSQEQFQKAALQKNQKTYTDWYFDQRSDDLSEAHQQVQDFAHDLLKNILKPSPRQLEDWKYIRATIPLNNADIEILFLLGQKLNIKKELCRYLVLKPALDPKLALTSGCREVSETFPAAILAKMNRRDLLLIDGLPFRKEEIPKSILGGSYQWKIISDEFRDRAFTGTAAQLARQELVTVGWVDGTESRYELRHEDPGVRATSEIVFKESKLAPGIPVPRTFSSWAQDHKATLWTAGVLLAGFAAYGLRDKNLVITNP